MIKSLQHTSFYLVVTLLLINQTILACAADDTIDISRSIQGNETLISTGGRFELGFFSPGDTKNWYIGIWYKNVTVKTPVWVANRENPVRNISEAALKIIEPGTLAILNETNHTVWSSNTTSNVQNPIVQLLDTGNLVLRDASNERPEDYLWQSFDYLTDTFLTDMDFGWNYMNGKERYLSSWRSKDDPAPGDFTFHIDPTGYPQGITKRREVDIVYRHGPWNGILLSGTPKVEYDPSFRIGVYSRNGTFFYRQDSIDRSVFSRVTLSPDGVVQRFAWIDRTQQWTVSLSMPGDNCDNYKLCHANGVCVIGNSNVCSCLENFLPQDPQGWARLDWSNGCVRRIPLNCESGDGFLKQSNMKLPDARNSWHNESMTLDQCKVECLKNCNCTAYTNLDIRGKGSGCILWFADLVDMRVLPADGQDIYVRVSSSELDTESKRKRKGAVVISLTVAGTCILVLGFLTYLWKRKKTRFLELNAQMRPDQRSSALVRRQDHDDLEIPFFDFQTILRASDNFSTNNKLGEGGYGPVYKGMLQEGQHIAVKRLSATSTQGLEEFKNEVLYISKLQHRNLVRLLGYCRRGCYTEKKGH